MINYTGENIVKGKKKKNDPKAVLTSGILFIGDAEYFAQPINNDVTKRFPNPLESFHYTSNLVQETDVNEVAFPNGISGRGLVVQTFTPDSRFKVKKKIKDGKLKAITIELE